MSTGLLRGALLAALALAGVAARAETWDAADVAEAERLRAEEAARAADYRDRVAHGDVRAAAAPMPREAPQRPRAAGDPLREAADLIDLLERWLEGGGDARALPAEPRRDELRRREREQRQGGAW